MSKMGEENSIFVRLLIQRTSTKNFYFIPSPQSAVRVLYLVRIFQSAFYTLSVFHTQSAVRSSQSAVHVLYWPVVMYSSQLWNCQLLKMRSNGDLARSISELKDESRSSYLPYSENLHKNTTLRWRSSRQLLLVFRNLKRKAARSSSYLILKFLNTSSLLRPPFRRLRLKLKRSWKS